MNMKATNTNSFIASSVIAMTLLTAAPAFAESGSDRDGNDRGFSLNVGGMVRLMDDGRDSDRKEDREKVRKEFRENRINATTTVHVSGTVTGISGSMLTLSGKNGATYTVNAANATIVGDGNLALSVASINLGDALEVKGTLSGSLITASKIHDKRLVKRSMIHRLDNINIGVVSSIGSSTFALDPLGAQTNTSVATNASTVFKINGKATTSSALHVGDLVFVNGSSTSAVSIDAALVNIVKHGWSFLRHFLFR